MRNNLQKGKTEKLIAKEKENCQQIKIIHCIEKSLERNTDVRGNFFLFEKVK